MNCHRLIALAKFADHISFEDLDCLADCEDLEGYSALTFTGFGQAFEWTPVFRVRTLSEGSQVALTLKGNQIITLPLDYPCLFAAKHGEIALRSMTPADASSGALIPYISYVTDDEFYHQGVLTLAFQRPTRLKLDMPLGYSLGYVLGLLFENSTCIESDRSSLPSKALRVSLPRLLQANFIKCLVDLYEDHRPDFTIQGNHIVIHCACLASFCEDVQGNSRAAYFPKFLLSSPRNFREGYFDALMEERVSIPNDFKLNAEFSSLASVKVYGIRWLAATLNIASTIRQRGKLFSLRFRSADIAQMCGMVTDLHRQERLHRDLGDDVPSQPSDIVPVPKSLLRLIKQLFPREDNATRTAIKVAHKSGYVTRITAKLWLERWREQIFNEEDGLAWRKLVADTRICWSPIKEINELDSHESVLPVLGNDASCWATVDGLLLAPARSIELCQ